MQYWARFGNFVSIIFNQWLLVGYRTSKIKNGVGRNFKREVACGEAGLTVSVETTLMKIYRIITRERNATNFTRQNRSISTQQFIVYFIGRLRIKPALMPVLSPKYLVISGRNSRTMAFRWIFAFRYFSLCLTLGLPNFFFLLLI